MGFGFVEDFEVVWIWWRMDSLECEGIVGMVVIIGIEDGGEGGGGGKGGKVFA